LGFTQLLSQAAGDSKKLGLLSQEQSRDIRIIYAYFARNGQLSLFTIYQ